MTDRSLTDTGHATPSRNIRNSVLGGLVLPASSTLVPVRLTAGQVLADRGAPLQHLHFVESGLVCFLEGPGSTVSPQLAMVGADGVVGLLELISGARTAFATAIVQVHGEAFRMNLADAGLLLAGATPQDAAAHGGADDQVDAARLAVQSLVRQIMETAAVNARDSLVQRLVRWLLMARVRLGVDEVPVTHEVLGAMLGVRRAGVTVAMTALQVQGLIRTGRGRITLLDIDGLTRLNVRGFRERA